MPFKKEDKYIVTDSIMRPNHPNMRQFPVLLADDMLEHIFQSIHAETVRIERKKDEAVERLEYVFKLPFFEEELELVITHMKNHTYWDYRLFLSTKETRTNNQQMVKLLNVIKGMIQGNNQIDYHTFVKELMMVKK